MGLQRIERAELRLSLAAGFVIIRSHFEERIDIFLLIQIEREGDLALFRERKAVKRQCVDLVFIGRIVNGAFQFPKMSFSREYAHERAVRFQNAGKFLRVIGREEIQQNIHAFVFRGQIENACDGKTELSVLGGGVDGIAGNVNAVYGCAFAERLSDVRGVEAFSAARIQNDGIFFRVSADGLGNGLAQNIVKARAEKGASCVSEVSGSSSLHSAVHNDTRVW